MKLKRDPASAAALALVTGLVHAQGGPMMGGGSWFGSGMGGAMDGYGGVWIPILLVVIVALLVWVVMQRRK